MDNELGSFKGIGAVIKPANFVPMHRTAAGTIKEFIAFTILNLHCSRTVLPTAVASSRIAGTTYTYRVWHIRAVAWGDLAREVDRMKSGTTIYFEGTRFKYLATPNSLIRK